MAEIIDKVKEKAKGVVDNIDDDSNNGQQKVSQYSEIITKLIDKVINKDVTVTFTFDHMKIDIPSARGPGGKELGGAEWTINGKIIIATTSSSRPTSTTSTTESLNDSSKYITT
jgi:hypothetical protein